MLYMYVYVYMHIAYMQNVTTGYGRQQANTLHCAAIISSSQKRIHFKDGIW